MMKPSLEDMWKQIQEFGIDRKILDPHDQIGYDRVKELYTTIIERLRNHEQINLLKEEINKEKMN